MALKAVRSKENKNKGRHIYLRHYENSPRDKLFSDETGRNMSNQYFLGPLFIVLGRCSETSLCVSLPSTYLPIYV